MEFYPALEIKLIYGYLVLFKVNKTMFMLGLRIKAFLAGHLSSGAGVSD